MYLYDGSRRVDVWLLFLQAAEIRAGVRMYEGILRLQSNRLQILSLLVIDAPANQFSFNVTNNTVNSEIHSGRH